MIKAARRIVEKLRLNGYEAFFAGGWVRDFLLRRKPKDIDIATCALPEDVLRLFPHSIAIGAKFGVIQVHSFGHVYEVATFRSDSTYLDGRHPSSISFSGPEQDALRRDFTINGLFYDPAAGRLIDFIHGKNDIQHRLIRTIGNPEERFSEDKLRLLRAIRFACNLDFTIVPETWEAIRNSSSTILQVSWERIRDELILIFTGAAPDKGLDLLHESGLLRHILPEVENTIGITNAEESSSTDIFTHTRRTLSFLRKPPAILAFGTLLHDAGKFTPFPAGRENRANPVEEICRRLKMSNEEIEQVADLVTSHPRFYEVAEMRESALIRLLRKPAIDGHMELFRADCLSTGKRLELYQYCLEKIRAIRKRPVDPPLVNGDDLIAMGYTPGPVFKEIIQTVEDLQLEEKLRTREEALIYIKNVFPVEGETRS